MTSAVFQSLEVFPAYASGFEFAWSISPGFNEPAPWTFTIFEGHTPAGPWEDISGPLTSVRRWNDETKRIVPKSDTLWFMCRLVSGANTWDSHAVAPYSALNRREFLLGRDIMRREVLHAKTLAGVQVLVYVVSTSGPKCPECLDPITGQVRDPHCPVCGGTGRAEAYLGPYRAWALITPKQRTTQHSEAGGTEEPTQFELRMIGTLPLKKNDVIADPGTGRMFYVDAAQNVAELRRVPLVQTVAVLEAPVSDPAYNLEPHTSGD